VYCRIGSQGGYTGLENVVFRFSGVQARRALKKDEGRYAGIELQVFSNGGAWSGLRTLTELSKRLNQKRFLCGNFCAGSDESDKWDVSDGGAGPGRVS
jgi:hypothetical protein